MTPYTDTQCDQLLAKMLPDDYRFYLGELVSINDYFHIVQNEIKLQLCWDIEEGLTKDERSEYADVFRVIGPNCTDIGDWCVLHATWQQRVTAIAKVKGVTL